VRKPCPVSNQLRAAARVVSVGAFSEARVSDEFATRVATSLEITQ